MKTKYLRDFVYLDWERVRSYTAQLFEGLPDASGSERVTEIGAEGKAGGNLFLFKGQAGVDMRYIRTENETRSLHHHVYSMFEEDLLHRSIIRDIDKSFDLKEWALDCFKDGEFIRITGRIRLVDFQWLSTMMNSMPEMMQTIHHFQRLSMKENTTESGLKHFQKKQQEELKEIKSLKVERLTKLIQQIYGEIVRVKVVPKEDHPANVFVGTAMPSFFYEPLRNLIFRYGHDINADWVIVGQISNSNSRETHLELPIGNQMEDAFETLAFALNDVIRTASEPKFPAVAFTPISIYRTISAPLAV